MVASLFETTVGAFEARMALRRKMLSVTGVVFPECHVPKDVQDEIRDSVVNCYECTCEDLCIPWLDSATSGTTPPDFCPNVDTILRLKAMGCSKDQGNVHSRETV